MAKNIWGEGVLDSKDSNDPNSVLYKGVIENNILQKGSDKAVDDDNDNDGKCGSEFRDKVKCTRYGAIYGPIHRGSIPLKDFEYWSKLIDQNTISEEEKDILIGMSPNEGNMDAVQSYDSEVITVGAMQKTLTIGGIGQFYIQILEFKNEHSEKYEDLFVNCGWKIQEGKLKYKDIYGNELKNLIRKGFDKENFGKAVRSKPIEPLIKACYDEDFQTKQVMDFIKALNEILSKNPSNYSNSINSYIKSKLGKATVLDQYVNRPAYVPIDLSKALTNFFAKNPEVNKNPSNWGANHNDYEREIIDDYGVNRRGTDMKNRYQKLKKSLATDKKHLHFNNKRFSSHYQ